MTKIEKIEVLERMANNAEKILDNVNIFISDPEGLKESIEGFRATANTLKMEL